MRQGIRGPPRKTPWWWCQQQPGCSGACCPGPSRPPSGHALGSDALLSFAIMSFPFSPAPLSFLCALGYPCNEFQFCSPNQRGELFPSKKPEWHTPLVLIMGWKWNSEPEELLKIKRNNKLQVKKLDTNLTGNQLKYKCKTTPKWCFSFVLEALWRSDQFFNNFSVANLNHSLNLCLLGEERHRVDLLG